MEPGHPVGVHEEAHCFSIKVLFEQGIKYMWLKLRSIIQLPMIAQSPMQFDWKR